MAGQTAIKGHFDPYLSTTQQDLLVAALTSNNASAKQGVNSYVPTGGLIKRSPSDPKRSKQITAPAYVDGAFFDSHPNSNRASADFSNFNFEDTSPYLGYVEGDTSFGFEASDLGDQQMFGSLPGAPTTGSSNSSNDGEKPDKRKSHDEDLNDDEVDHKRQEGEDKQAKKPGRKPITSEPTTKRKAQNRAAQRAFRDRKEKHLKDLETKVDTLTKTSEAERQANGLLKAQIERLQTELQEYKKRMSMSGTGINQSPPTTARFPARSNSNSQSDFQFDFSRFGVLSGPQLPGSQARTSSQSENAGKIELQNVASRPLVAGSTVQSPAQMRKSPSPRTTSTNAANGFHSALPQMPAGTTLDGLFSPSILNGTGSYGFPPNTANTIPADNGTDSNSGISRAFRFNSGSISSNTQSPSTSSQSPWNAASSCGTSPEPVHESPSSDNKQNNITTTQDLQSTKAATTDNIFGNNMPSFDWVAAQNGGQFDPVLFDGYRESQDAIVGDGDFNNGFFNDALAYDFGSPLNFSEFTNSPKLQTATTPASRNLLAEVEKAREGNDDDYLDAATLQQVQQPQQKDHVVRNGEKMVNCNTIWSQLQNNRDFQDGKFDLDGLCAELRAKAKCSESGVTVPEVWVDEAFKKLGSTQDATKPMPAPPIGAATLPANPYQEVDQSAYVFPKDSVDEALRKLGAP